MLLYFVRLTSALLPIAAQRWSTPCLSRACARRRGCRPPSAPRAPTLQQLAARPPTTCALTTPSLLAHAERGWLSCGYGDLCAFPLLGCYWAGLVGSSRLSAGAQHGSGPPLAFARTPESTHAELWHGSLTVSQCRLCVHRWLHSAGACCSPPRLRRCPRARCCWRWGRTRCCAGRCAKVLPHPEGKL
jgi:hypothetical protein